MAKSVPEQLADLVFADLATTHPGLTTAFGRRALEENLADNVVIAVSPGAPQIFETTQPGDTMDPTRGRRLYHRRLTIEWHCHGVRNATDTDFAVAEMIYLDTLRAVRRVTHASINFSGERWESQQEGQDSYERRGEVISFISEIDSPIYEIRSGGIITLTATPPIATTVTLNGQEETP
jgi:hypothetical protein